MRIGRKRVWSLFGATGGCVLALALPVGAAKPAPGSSGPCALGESLSAAGEVAAAKKAFVAVLKADPASACAAKGLEKLNQPKKKPSQCEIGDAYRAVHRDDDAIAAYGKQLEENPESDCATTGLTEAGPSRASRLADEITGSIPTFLVFAGLVLIAWYLLLYLCRIKPLKELLFKLWKPGAYIKYTLRPRLKFAAIGDDAVEGKPGAPLMARIKERLGRMRQEALDKEATPEYDLDFGTPREEFADQVSESKSLEAALDSAAEVSDQTKMVAALLKVLSAWLPIRRFAVAGSLEPPAKGGAALSLTLEEEGKSEAATRLQGPSGPAKPEAPDYMVLADPAAVWIQYGIACALEGEKPDAAKAESQALLREGLDRYHREELAEAREAFEKAIVLDVKNWGAYVSLAIAEARSGRDYSKSITRILKGIERMQVAHA